MLYKRILPFIFLAVCGISLWAFKKSDATGGDINTNQQILLSAIGSIIEQKHFSPKVIDDAFSKQVFTKYLTTMDAEKDIFIQPDINALKQYETTIDEEIHGAPLQFYPAAAAIYIRRAGEAVQLYKEILSTPFDYSINEMAELDPDKTDFPANEVARKEVWRKRLKFASLQRYTELQELRNKNKDTDTAWDKTDAQLEKQAREQVQSSFDKVFNRQKLMFTGPEQFNMYVNTITNLMDPQTEYFPPVEKRAFDELMTGRFFGIGAQLKDDDGAIKIASLITGSPASKSGQVQVNDEIIKVAQAKDEPVDVRGYAVTDVVKLIRGNKGTEVKITFKKTDGTMQVISMIRDEIVQDESFARSAIINDNGKKTGYIYLPDFYADYDRPDGNRCSQDVATEVMKLKKENVEGIIIDLRNNGGGSLYEVVQMVGLFIKQGPVVQVKDRNGTPSVLSDTDPSVLYDGPLAVMINEFSASASEIFAAAIQDYKRGIVVGSTSSYGKGTVQKTLPLGKPTDISTGQTEFGALKITFEKFYRINGSSTQLKGVTPDIILPDTYEYLDYRMKSEPSALPWDQIKSTDYTLYNSGLNWQKAIGKSNQRINNSIAFSTIKNNTDWLGKNADKNYSLNIFTYKAEQDLIKKTVRQDNNLSLLKDPMDVKPAAADKDKFYNNTDKAKGERYQQWLINVQQDIYINETENIITDTGNYN